MFLAARTATLSTISNLTDAPGLTVRCPSRATAVKWKNAASSGLKLVCYYSCWAIARTCSLVTSMSWTSHACSFTLATSSSSVSPRTTCPQKHCMIFAIVISSFLAASYATLVARMLAACCQGVGDAAQDLLDRQGTGRGRRRDPPRRTTLDGKAGPPRLRPSGLRTPQGRLEG